MTDLVTIRGNVGKTPSTNTLPSGTPVTNFSVATTPRWYDYNQGMWREGTTSWYQVRTYRSLAENCGRCLYQGQPVIVTGRLNIREWTDKEGRPRVSAEIDATAVGHDLNMGPSSYIKPERKQVQQDAQGRTQHSPMAASAPVNTDTGEILKIENHANSGSHEDFEAAVAETTDTAVYTSESAGFESGETKEALEEKAPY